MEASVTSLTRTSKAAASVVAAGLCAIAPTLSLGAPAATASTCVTSVSIGPLASTTECFRRQGLTWSTSGPVDFGGLKMTPGPNARFVVDPFNARVSAQGYSAAVQGPFPGITDAVQTIRIIRSGNFDITFQRRPEADRSTQFIGVTQGRAIDPGTIAELPGLDQVAALPSSRSATGALLTGMPDYAQVAPADVATLQSSGRISGGVTGPTVVVRLDTLGLADLEPLVFTLPDEAGVLLGTQVRGGVKVTPESVGGRFGFTLDLSAQFPDQLSGVAGHLRLFVAPGGVINLDRFKFEAGEIAIPKAFTLKPVLLEWDSRLKAWGGRSTLYIPALSRDGGFGADVRVADGKLQRAGLSVGVAIRMGKFTISRMAGAFEANPFLIEGSTTLGFGPPAPGVSGTGPLVSLDGTVNYTAGKAKLSGKWFVGGVELGTTGMDIDGTGVAIRGALGARIGDFQVSGQASGFAEWSPDFRFNVEGAASIRYGLFNGTGQALISGTGMAGCASTTLMGHTFSIGAGYLWQSKELRWLDATCDMGSFRVVRADGTATERGIREMGAGRMVMPVAAGSPVPKGVAIRVAGQGAPPEVDIPGLGVSTGAGVTQQATWMSVEDPSSNTTTIIIPRPQLVAGRSYSVSARAGSAPITSIATANVLDRPTVRAQRNGDSLDITVANAASLRRDGGGPATLVIEEVGPGVRHEVGRYPVASGSVPYVAPRGPAGTHRFIARIEQGGLPRAESVAGRYRATASRLARPSVRVVRTGPTSARLRWSRVPGATGYVVTARFNNDLVRYELGPGRRSLALVNVAPESPISARVRAESTYPALGPVGSARVAGRA